uniref:Uncharacterized protein n=1 Tax=Setaria viridis TaxID=4556 RepID=A0A4U6U865_SETVI|nr:hypothetical protein SEVIR_7G242000v2 [Setaria viridis]
MTSTSLTYTWPRRYVGAHEAGALAFSPSCCQGCLRLRECILWHTRVLSLDDRRITFTARVSLSRGISACRFPPCTSYTKGVPPVPLFLARLPPSILVPPLFLNIMMISLSRRGI